MGSSQNASGFVESCKALNSRQMSILIFLKSLNLVPFFQNFLGPGLDAMEMFPGIREVVHASFMHRKMSCWCMGPRVKLVENICKSCLNTL